MVDLDAPGRRVLALTERFHDGWSASIDDVPRATVRVEQDFLGSIVDAGVHRVRLRLSAFALCAFRRTAFGGGALVSQLAARIFQVSPNEPLELLQFGRLVDQDVLGDPINLFGFVDGLAIETVADRRPLPAPSAPRCP